MSSATLITGFIVSSIGLPFFIYGKKQKRAPQLVVGIFLMAAPILLRNPLWLGVAAGLSLIGLRLAVLNQW